jgi:DNA-directed RNA polymerase specialized sigma24 family protein
VAGRNEFPTTHWSLVAEAGGEAGKSQQSALGRLLNAYMPPLRMYLVYAKRIPLHQADDLLQSFIADQILERRLLQSAEQNRGRFRAFIVTALRNFCVKQRRYEKAKKRQPNKSIPLDEALGLADIAASPAEVFDLMWARQVLAQAIDLMRAECQRRRPQLWRLFEARVLAPALYGKTPISYAQMVADFGFVSPTQAANAVVTANRMFARMLRKVVGRYEKDPEEIEEEIRNLRVMVSNFAAKRSHLAE